MLGIFTSFTFLILTNALIKNEFLLLPQLFNGSNNVLVVLKTGCYLDKNEYCFGNCSKFITTKTYENSLINKLIRNGTNTFVVKNDEQYGCQMNKRIVIPNNGSLYIFALPYKFKAPILIIVNLSSKPDMKCDFTQINLNLTDCTECMQNNLFKSEDVQIINDINITNSYYRSSEQLLEYSTMSTKIKFPEEIHTQNNSKISSRQTSTTRYGKVNLPPLIIETNINSQLRISPGQNPKVVFDVMSNMDKVVYVTFSCRDDRGILRDLVPRWSWIMPGQVIQVTVLTTLGGSNPSNTMTNFADTITLIALGNGVSKTEKSVLIEVSNFKSQDTVRPYLTYQFTTTCAIVRSSICESEMWTVEIRAQDKESGILQVGSNPIGINFPTSYVSGTKELITGHYTASCCEPYLEIYAVDVNNNRRTYKLDANYLYLSDASIAAVVLGVILLIILIIVIGLLIRRKYYEKDSLDLPTFRGQKY